MLGMDVYIFFYATFGVLLVSVARDWNEGVVRFYQLARNGRTELCGFHL